MFQLLYNPKKKKGKRFVNSSMFKPLINGSSFKRRDLIQVNVQIKINKIKCEFFHLKFTTKKIS